MLMMLAVVQVIRAEVGLRGAGDVDDACRCASDTLAEVGLMGAGDVDDACRCCAWVQGMLMMLAVVQVMRRGC